MKALRAIALTLVLTLSAFGQTTAPTTPPIPTNVPTGLPNFVFGGGVSYGNPGLSGAADFDALLTPSGIYAHIAAGSVTFRNGTAAAVVRPGLEWRFYQSGNLTLVAQGDGGLTTGGTATLSQFTAGFAIEFDACAYIKTSFLSHCYLRGGASLAGGTSISTTTTSTIQFIPVFEIRFPVF
jgi:hypothetical protein